MSSVTTCVVVWIEILYLVLKVTIHTVTTCVVVWIEMSPIAPRKPLRESPPAWWCGLKSASFTDYVFI